LFADIQRGGQRPGLPPCEGDGCLRVAQLFGISKSESMCPALVFHDGALSDSFILDPMVNGLNHPDLQTIDEYMNSKPAITRLKYENRWVSCYVSVRIPLTKDLHSVDRHPGMSQGDVHINTHLLSRVK
jgi:hypothetical protein